jgi:hypothetical protein
MKHAIFALAALTLIGLPSAASAQQSEQDYAAVEDAMQARFSAFYEALSATRNRPDRWTVVFSRIDSFAISWTIVGFGPDRANGTPWPWRAQRLTSDSPAPFVANDASCPALRQQLGAIERIPLPTIDIPNAGRELPPPTEIGSMVLDGDTNRLWTSEARFGSRWILAGIEISGNVDTPLARWADTMMAALAPCWRPSPN